MSLDLRLARSRWMHSCALSFVALGKHRSGDIGNRCARKLALQSLDCGRGRLAQNRQDMRADRTGWARRRPALVEKIAPLQRSKDIAQRDVARWPRQFEAASRTEPSANQPRACHQREEAAH